VGHKGIHKTLHRLRSESYIPGHQALVQDWVSSHATCQWNKTETFRSAAFYNPSRNRPKSEPTSGLTSSKGCQRVVCWAGGSLPSSPWSTASPSTPTHHARPSLHRDISCSLVRGHCGATRVPSSIVSDKDPVFTRHVWRNLFKMVVVTLCMSMTFHHQTDGQTEVVNRVIATYLRCVTSDRPRAWLDWLPWAEHCYNTSYHSALRATPFVVVYKRSPRPCCHTNQGRHAWRRPTPSYVATTTIWLMPVNASSKPNSSPRSTITPRTTTWSGRWGSGCGCAYSTGQPNLWMPEPRGSSVRATQAPYAC
jgi:hypothetical protein